MILFDYHIDVIDFAVEVTPHFVPMTKLHFASNGRWETIHVPNDQIQRQLRDWDEAGIDYSIPA